MDLSFLRDVNIWSVLARTLLAVFCGSIVGLERESRRKQAGFRTHILICLGASITTLTSQYLLLVMHQYTDIARLGAQVIAGLGFIGAGAIIVTRNLRIKGLTTAAGLWVTGIIGLCCGAGYYEAAIVATLLLTFIEFFMAKIEKKFIIKSEKIDLLIEFDDIAGLTGITKFLNDLELVITNMEFFKEGQGQTNKPSAIIEFMIIKKITLNELITSITALPHVTGVKRLNAEK